MEREIVFYTGVTNAGYSVLLLLAKRKQLVANTCPQPLCQGPSPCKKIYPTPVQRPIASPAHGSGDSLPQTVHIESRGHWLCPGMASGHIPFEKGLVNHWDVF